MMDKKILQICKDKWLYIKDHKVDSLLVVGVVLIVIGIVLSLLGKLWANLIILLGTSFLGIGFYVKGKNSPDTILAGYGHFMLGLGALIALPQTPEILNKIWEIRDGVMSLKIAQRKSTDILAELTAHITHPIAKSAANEVDEKSPKKIESIIESFVLKSVPCQSKKFAPKGGFPHQEEKKPTSGMVFLTQENADKIIEKLGKEGFSKDKFENLLQENLEVWRPHNDLSKCEKAPSKQ